jgi:hypothetical protein
MALSVRQILILLHLRVRKNPVSLPITLGDQTTVTREVLRVLYGT